MGEVTGNIKGIKSNILSDLKKLYDYTPTDNKYTDRELLTRLARLTGATGREIAVYINRRGRILNVTVGDAYTAPLPEAGVRQAPNRLSGIACLHTHTVKDSALSDLDISALKLNRYDMMMALGVDGQEEASVSAGFIAGITADGDYFTETVGPFTPFEAARRDFTAVIRRMEQALARSAGGQDTREKAERAYIVSIDRGTDDLPVEESLEELARLVATAGALVVGRTFQKRPQPDAGFYLGSGRIRDLALACQETAATVAVFDDELSPAQEKVLEEELGLKIVDRTTLILDIFAQRAHTHEGKLQVELAQLKYRLPRLGGQGMALSRLGGGIGARGPGETKLETDRRHIRQRVAEIEKNLEKVKNVRKIHFDSRRAGNKRLASLIGYTNAGKSTLLNTLTKAEVCAEDKLFATLDPTTRRLPMPSGQEVLLTDTVGFIRKLPHQLIAAFRATLEEVRRADVLLHVIDASHPFYQEQSDAVYNVLEELGVHDKTIITVFNKVDKIPPETLRRLLRQDNSAPVSAVTGAGLAELLILLDENLKQFAVEEEYIIPYDKGDVLAHLYKQAAVSAEEYTARGVLVKASGSPANLRIFQKYRR